MSDLKWTWETARFSEGAGIIIVKKKHGIWKVLGLWARGGYDITKGHLEEGETALETAIRECSEEANITNVNMKWGKDCFILDKLTVFIGTTRQEPKLIHNPHSGILEHEHIKWLDWDEMKGKTYPYLKPAIEWAQDIVEK